MAQRDTSLGPKPSYFWFFLFVFSFAFLSLLLIENTRLPPWRRAFLSIFLCLPLFLFSLFWVSPFSLSRSLSFSCSFCLPSFLFLMSISGSCFLFLFCLIFVSRCYFVCVCLCLLSCCFESQYYIYLCILFCCCCCCCCLFVLLWCFVICLNFWLPIKNISQKMEIPPKNKMKNAEKSGHFDKNS